MKGNKNLTKAGTKTGSLGPEPPSDEGRPKGP